MLKEVILKETKEINGQKRLFCTQAFKIADEFNITPMEIGKICNEESIKISACQLGCF